MNVWTMGITMAFWRKASPIAHRRGTTADACCCYWAAAALLLLRWRCCCAAAAAEGGTRRAEWCDDHLSVRLWCCASALLSSCCLATIMCVMWIGHGSRMRKRSHGRSDGQRVPRWGGSRRRRRHVTCGRRCALSSPAPRRRRQIRGRWSHRSSHRGRRRWAAAQQRKQQQRLEEGRNAHERPAFYHPGFYSNENSKRRGPHS